MTASPSISEPVPDNVSIVPKGMAVVTGNCLINISHGSPLLNNAAADTNFVPSITDPPPTASKKSYFYFLIFDTACINVS
jgi:hypothetical protein